MLDQSLKAFIDERCGGVAAVAGELALTERSIYKWAANGSLPRTEYSDETKYSEVLSKMSGVPEKEIKNSFRPQPKR